LNATITTDNLGLVVPEILTKYGSGKAVGLSGQFITKEGKFTLTPTDNSVTTSIAVTVTVDGEEAIYVELNDILATGQVSSKAGAVFGALSTATIGTASSNFRTTLAGVTAASFQKELQTNTNSYVATLNALLQKGIVIPTFLGIKISGLVLQCNQGFVHGEIEVTPATWTGISDLMVAFAEELRYIRRLNRIEEINAAYYAARQ
jgi:hypothetical protein|tara:strand:- start:122 stop:736 length:615 start_codon:yes stop_codon:yes gene_type:complete